MDVVIIAAGRFRGRWVPYRPRRTRAASELFSVLCLRCQAVSHDPGQQGWVYSRSDVWRSAKQLCPQCFEAVCRAVTET